MVESWWNHGVESHLRRSFCDSTMIPLQIYDSTKTTIIPLVELWWNYRGGITKIVSESSVCPPNRVCMIDVRAVVILKPHVCRAGQVPRHVLYCTYMRHARIVCHSG